MNLRLIKANMTELELKDGITILFSYQTPVAAHGIGQNNWYMKTEKFWSKTTSRHINQWLAGNKAVTNPQSYFDNLVKGV